MQRGGRCVYFGDIGKDAYVLRDYLSRHGAVAGPSDNIAEYMLEAIGAGSSPRVGDRDWADIWSESPELANVKDRISSFKESGKAATAALLTHCRRELFHASWAILLDDKFMHAYEHGMVIDCKDGVRRRVYPRIFTYSADYPEKCAPPPPPND